MGPVDGWKSDHPPQKQGEGHVLGCPFHHQHGPKDWEIYVSGATNDRSPAISACQSPGDMSPMHPLGLVTKHSGVQNMSDAIESCHGLRQGRFGKDRAVVLNEVQYHHAPAGSRLEDFRAAAGIRTMPEMGLYSASSRDSPDLTPKSARFLISRAVLSIKWMRWDRFGDSQTLPLALTPRSAGMTGYWPDIGRARPVFEGVTESPCVPPVTSGGSPACFHGRISRHRVHWD